MPPGQTIVLVTPDRKAVWGWWRPDPTSGIKAMNGLDGLTCTIFRNEGPILSSTLILDAELAVREFGLDVGPDGLLTYVWDKKIRSSNPGYCFLMAGWKKIGRSADGKKTLLQKKRRLTRHLTHRRLPSIPQPGHGAAVSGPSRRPVTFKR